jgi:hypothetical protein
MRIVVASAPKSGNNWIKCLLSRIYGLTWLSGEETPATKADAFTAWVERGGFPANSIYHQHGRFSKDLANAIEAAPARIVTIVRDPYDMFVSLYSWVQDRVENDVTDIRPRPRDVMIGKPIDHPDVLTFLGSAFASNLTRANGWLHSGRAVVVRYEGLHHDPVVELTRATDQIAPVAQPPIIQAIEECRAENMRRMSDMLAWHVRAAKIGDSRDRLSEQHLAIFRERYPDIIRSLGYEVR